VHLLFAGGYDFAKDIELSPPQWTPLALPSVIDITDGLSDASNPLFLYPGSITCLIAAIGERGTIVLPSGVVLRARVLATGDKSYTVLLPLDRVFDIRVTAALRLWYHLNSRKVTPYQTLPFNHMKRLVLALRALDGKHSNASYRQIADGLFGLGDAVGGAWKGHDLRDRTIRLVRLGTEMMNGGYRRLLLYPYRRKLPTTPPTSKVK
jgi:hypothetical protein